MGAPSLGRIRPAVGGGLGGLPGQSANTVTAPLSAWPVWGIQPVYSSVSLDTSAQSASAQSLLFSADGTKFFLLGSGSPGTGVYQYSCPTPYSLSGASYDTVFLAVSGQDTGPKSMCWNFDGSKLFVAGDSGNLIFQYNCPTPYSVASAAYDSVLEAVTFTDPRGIASSSDGSRLFISSNTGYIKEFTLDPTDLTTLTWTGYTLSGLGVGMNDIRFNDLGTLLYVLVGGGVKQFALSEPFILSTAIDTGAGFLPSEVTYPFGLAMNASDGSTMILVDSVPDITYQYNVGS